MRAGFIRLESWYSEICMRDLTRDKSEVIDSLVKVTALMLQEVYSGDLDVVERGLRERDRLFKRLSEIDGSIEEQPQNQEEIWMKQLKSLEDLSIQLQRAVEVQMNYSENQRRSNQNAKEMLINFELMTAKGGKIGLKV